MKISSLDKKLQVKAFRNHRKQNKDGELLSFKEFVERVQLSKAFFWAASPEGDEYWRHIHANGKEP